MECSPDELDKINASSPFNPDAHAIIDPQSTKKNSNNKKLNKIKAKSLKVRRRSPEKSLVKRTSSRFKTPKQLNFSRGKRN